jgi:hypothetical protein
MSRGNAAFGKLRRVKVGRIKDEGPRIKVKGILGIRYWVLGIGFRV